MRYSSPRTQDTLTLSVIGWVLGVIIKGKIYKNLAKSYYGGIVDTYIPIGINLEYHDVNSLFPFAILNDIPVGNPTYTTESDLFKLFGFVKVEIGVAKHKKAHAKKNELREKDIKREAQREIKERFK